MSVNGGAYDSLSDNAWNCVAWGWNPRPHDNRKSGLFAAADLRGIFYFIGNIGRMPAFAAFYKKLLKEGKS